MNPKIVKTLCLLVLPTLLVKSLFAQQLLVDEQFGDSGHVVTLFDYPAEINSVQVRKDGKIIASGYYDSLGNHHSLIACYHNNGLLDTSFGYDGVIKKRISDAHMPYAMALQSDGKIIVGGNQRLPGGFPYVHHGVLVRYHADGRVDEHFGSDGMVVLGLKQNEDDLITTIAIQEDDKIVVGGFAENKFLLARYNEMGTIDTSFGSNGIVLTSLADQEQSYINSIAIQPDGKILAGGYAGYGGLSMSAFQFALARYTSTGYLDETFGNEGYVMSDIPVSTHDVIKKLIVQDDAKFVVAGYSGSNVVLARYHLNGTLDQTFGNNGLAHTSICAGAQDLVRTKNGQYIIGGSKRITPFNSAACVAIFNEDGSLSTLGENPLINDAQDANDYVNSLFLSEEEVIIGGSSREANQQSGFFLAKYKDESTETPEEKLKNSLCWPPVHLNQEERTIHVNLDEECQSLGVHQIVVFSISGNEILRMIAKDNQSNLIEELPEGIYIYHVLTKHQSIIATDKLIVK